MSAVRRVGVVGCGQMGSGFADLCARAGLDVSVVAADESGVDRGRRRLAESWDRAVARGGLDRSEVDAAVSRISWETDLKALGDHQFVLEAVPEELAAKEEVFRVLDRVVEDPDAVLASTTSSIPVMRLGRVTALPERVIGLHLFHPVRVIPLVEVIASLRTSDETVRRTRAFVEDVLGKQVVLARDLPGFVVNALLVPYLLAAVRMVQAGTATAEEIDRGMTVACGHPMGPLALVDLIGLDTVGAVAEALHAEWREPHFAPPPLLLRMIEAGSLGRKSGAGFHRY